MHTFTSGRAVTLLAFPILMSAFTAHADGDPGQPAARGDRSIAQASGQDNRTSDTRKDQSSGQSGQAEQRGTSGQNTTKGAKQPAGSAGHPVVYMLVPIATADRSEAMKSGCWARFYDEQNYTGDSLTLTGPVDMANMTGPFGIDWKGKISSAQTGPKARVLVYDNEDFKDLVATIKPGQQVPNLDKKMGFFDEFSSIKIACEGKN